MARKKKVQPVEMLIETYEGRDVVQTPLQITHTGDGLSAAMAIEPTVLHHHATVYVVLECEVDKVSYPPIKDTNKLARMHTLKAGRATIVEKDLVLDALNAQASRIQAAVDSQAGQGALDLEKANLAGDHVLGEHKDGLVKGCPKCDQEKDAVADEAKSKAKRKTTKA